MEKLLLQVLIITYSATGVISFIGYWPTIKDLYRRRKPSANITSYIIWTCTGGVGFLYSVFILPDLPLRIVSGLNFTASFTVLILSIGLNKNR